MSQGVITFVGDSGKPEDNKVSMNIDGITSDAALATLATALATHTNCNVASRTFIQEFFDDDTAPGTDENVDRYAEIRMRDTDNGKSRRMGLPCPVPADVEVVDRGERMTPSALGTIVSAVAVATGKNLSGVVGPVLQKE
jgi:hypothetical protein